MSSEVIAYASSKSVVVRDVRSGGRTVLSSNEIVGPPVWSDDGRYLAWLESGRESRLVIWDSSTGRVTAQVVGSEARATSAFQLLFVAGLFVVPVEIGTADGYTFNNRSLLEVSPEDLRSRMVMAHLPSDHDEDWLSAQDGRLLVSVTLPSSTHYRYQPQVFAVEPNGSAQLLHDDPEANGGIDAAVLPTSDSPGLAVGRYRNGCQSDTDIAPFAPHGDGQAGEARPTIPGLPSDAEPKLLTTGLDGHIYLLAGPLVWDESGATINCDPLRDGPDVLYVLKDRTWRSLGVQFGNLRPWDGLVVSSSGRRAWLEGPFDDLSQGRLRVQGSSKPVAEGVVYAAWRPAS